jgi:phosphonate transport system permease protein
MAIAGTVIAVVVAFPLSFLAAKNTSPNAFFYWVFKTVVNLLRTIPDVALGLVLIAGVGLGPFPGTLALAFHTATVLIKLFSENIEQIDEGVVEAITATGASNVSVLCFGVIPQVIPSFISFILYRFEANIRSAAVLGLIGAGGIGTIMNTYFRLFQYPQAGITVFVLVMLVLLVDYSSARLRDWVN